jgi:hypothetical protein
VGDVITRDAAGVERTHGQLGTRLTDGLGGDDADRLTHVDELAGGQRAPVAHRAGADLGVAGQNRADLDLLHTAVDEGADHDVAEVLPGPGQGLAVDDHVGGKRPGVDAGFHGVAAAQGAIGRPLRDLHGQAALGAAVLLADDDVLGYVDQPASEVARVGRT